MHEYGLCEDVVAAVEQRAAGRTVRAFTVRIGAMHRVSQPAFDAAFELVRAGTVAESARADVVVEPVMASCVTCGAEAETVDPMTVCRSCGSPDLSLSGGEALVLESITLAST